MVQGEIFKTIKHCNKDEQNLQSSNVLTIITTKHTRHPNTVGVVEEFYYLPSRWPVPAATAVCLWERRPDVSNI